MYSNDKFIEARINELVSVIDKMEDDHRNDYREGTKILKSDLRNAHRELFRLINHIRTGLFQLMPQWTELAIEIQADQSEELASLP